VEPNDDLTDEALLVMARVDSEAFGRFYRRRLNVVLAFFLRRTNDRELAADLTAETFAAALVSVKRYQPERSTALAWLFTIAHRRLVDSLRHGRVESRARRSLRLEPLVLGDADLERVEQRASAAQGDSALELLEGLSADRREAIKGRILDEEEYRALAHRLRCSEAVVRQRVSRGLAELRTQMEEK